MINNKNLKQTLVKLGIVLILCILAEIFVFNYRFFFSCNDSIEVSSYHAGSGLKYENGKFVITHKNYAYIDIEDINNTVQYVYVNLQHLDDEVVKNTTDIKVQLLDEGNRYFYDAGSRVICDLVENSKYIRLYSYGNVKKIRIYIDESVDDTIIINNIILNARVPFRFNLIRVITIFLVIGVIAFFMPGSFIYRLKMPYKEESDEISQVKYITVFMSILVLAAIFLVMVQLSGVYNYPVWQHHKQYNMLAESLMEGRVDIDVTGDDVSALDNPYDTIYRQYEAPNAPWDIAYYNGKYYVYFGIVPELIFYLPFYAITGTHFSTWIGIYICAIAVMVGVFALLALIIKYRFNNVSFGVYLLTSIFFSTGCGLIPILFRPDFYSLPIIMALAFTIWGLTLWVSAAIKLERKQKAYGKLVAGALCMALVCGCRPQFLVGSAFFIPIFWKVMVTCYCGNSFNVRKIINKENIKRITAVALPYIIIFSALMYYNYVRFGSPFDFGANYNLTTNDMNYRGFNTGRLKDAIFMYVLQLPLISQVFPYIHNTLFSSDYMGKIIYESMYGGAIFINPVTLSLIPGIKNKRKFKDKAMWTMAVMCVVFMFVVCIADAQMAGILSRYYYDFMWLILLGAVIVIFNSFNIRADERISEKSGLTKKKKMILLLLVAGIVGIIYNTAIGIQQCELNSTNPYMYYSLMYYFS